MAPASGVPSGGAEESGVGDPVMTASVAVLGAAAAAVSLLVFRRRREVAVAVWTLGLFLTPVWTGVALGPVQISAFTAITILAIASSSWRGMRRSSVDVLVLVLLAAVLLALVIGGADSGHVQTVVLAWFLPYLWGRLILSQTPASWLGACLAVGATIAAVLAIIEFFTGRNIFLSLPGASSSVWGGQRERGGVIRAEGAFGHSIALGGTLAMVMPFVLALRWPVWVRAALTVLIGTATVLTISRLGIIGLAVSVVLAALLLGRYIDRAMRTTVVVMLAIGAALAGPTLVGIFGAAGAEAEGSAEYRADLLPLVDSMSVLGVSPAREITATGQDYWGGFRSIDSAFILLGLQFGLVPLAIAVGLVIVLIASVLWGRATPAGVALIAQIPAFATVALITQYAAFVWFVAGVAVSSYTVAARTDPPRESFEIDGVARQPVGVR